MKITEEKIKQIISEESIKYLEEIKGNMSPGEFKKFLQSISKSEKLLPEPVKHEDVSDEEDVFLMVFGEKEKGGALNDFPLCLDTRPCREILQVQQYLKRVWGIPYEHVIDKDGDPLYTVSGGKKGYSWNDIRLLVYKHYKQKMESPASLSYRAKWQKAKEQAKINQAKQAALKRKYDIALEEIIKESINSLEAPQLEQITKEEVIKYLKIK